MKKILMIGYIEFDRDPRVLREAKCLNEKHMVNVISLKNENLKGEVIFEGVKVFCVNQKRNMSNNKFNYIIEYLKFMYKAFLKSLVLTLKNNYDVYYFHNIPDFLVFIAFLQKCPASDSANRPDGVELFKYNDIEDFDKSLRRVLPNPSIGIVEKSEDNADKILNIYKQLME